MDAGEDGRVWLPFAWSGVSLRALGARAIRVRLSLLGERVEHGLRLIVGDADGAPVLSVASLRSRPADLDQLRAADQHGAHGLFALEWTRPTDSVAERTALDIRDWVTLGHQVPDLAELVTAVEGGADLPAVVVSVVETAAGDSGLAVVERVLTLVQSWLAEPTLADVRLALVTRDAVAAGDGPDVDVAAAGVWGLVRSVQLEHPDRFLLVDLEAGTARMRRTLWTTPCPQRSPPRWRWANHRWRYAPDGCWCLDSPGRLSRLIMTSPRCWTRRGRC